MQRLEVIKVRIQEYQKPISHGEHLVDVAAGEAFRVTFISLSIRTSDGATVIGAVKDGSHKVLTMQLSK